MAMPASMKTPSRTFATASADGSSPWPCAPLAPANTRRNPTEGGMYHPYRLLFLLFRRLHVVRRWTVLNSTHPAVNLECVGARLDDRILTVRGSRRSIGLRPNVPIGSLEQSIDFGHQANPTL